MLFSVVIPVYNRKDLLKDTLHSVFAQTDRDFEVLVIDDGSTDGSVDFIASFPEPITLLRQQNKGPGAARNLGLSVAQGEYIAFLDSDDIWFPWTLATYRSVIQRTREPALIIAATQPFRSASDLEPLKPLDVAVECFDDFFASSRVAMWHGASTIVVNATHARTVGGFTAEWVNAEDTDFLFRLGVAPGFARIIAPCTVGYRQHESSAVSNFSRTFAGISRLLSNEKRGAYPGGAARIVDRRRMACRHIRPASIQCLREGMFSKAWQLYAETFFWNVSLLRMKYLLGFPLRAASAWSARRLSGACPYQDEKSH